MQNENDNMIGEKNGGNNYSFYSLCDMIGLREQNENKVGHYFCGRIWKLTNEMNQKEVLM